MQIFTNARQTVFYRGLWFFKAVSAVACRMASLNLIKRVWFIIRHAMFTRAFMHKKGKGTAAYC